MPFLRAATTFVALLFSILVYGDPITIDLGPPSAFVTSTATDGPPLPTGKSLSLHRSNNGDVDLYLGDGLISDLGITLKDNCQNNDPKCESSVQDVLRASGNYDLQSRQVGLVLAVGGILLGMFAFQISETWKMDQSKPVPMHFNLDASQVSSATANPSATEAIFKTGSGDSGMDVTITGIPTSSATSTINTATLTTGIVVSTATDSANGHHPGDFILHFNDQGALTWLQNKAESSKTCPSKKFKRDSYGCAPAAATDAMGALTGDLANMLVMGPVLLRRFVRDGDLARAVRAIFDSGRAITVLASVSDDVLWALAEMFLYFFDEALNHAVPWAVDQFIPQNDFDTSNSTSNSTSTSGPCAIGKDTPACPDKDCQGDVTAATCTAAGPKSKCSCAPLVTPFVNLVDVNWFLAQQQILTSLASFRNNLKAPKPTLSCANDGPAHLDRDWAIGSVASFCESYVGKNISQDMPIQQNFAEGTQENFDNGVGQNTTLSISWAPECNALDSNNKPLYNIDIDECNNALNTTIEQCDTKGPNDGKHGGKVRMGCIVYDNAPQTHPPSAIPTESSTYCTSDDQCGWRKCPMGPSTCETFGAPGVNEQGLKSCQCTHGGARKRNVLLQRMYDPSQTLHDIDASNHQNNDIQPPDSFKTGHL